MNTDEARRLAEHVAQLSQLEDAWDDVELAEGAVLFAKGDPGDAVYSVVSGEIEVYTADRAGRKMVLERLGPGELVGELALLDSGPRAASVVAVTPTRLRMLHRDEFLAALAVSPELAEITIHMLSLHLRHSAGYLDLVTRWARQVARGEYQAARASIQDSADRSGDPNFARFVTTFSEMVEAVQAREADLRRELSELRVEIDERKFERQLDEVTDSEFFRSLQHNARKMRERVHGEAAGDDNPGPPESDGR